MIAQLRIIARTLLAHGRRPLSRYCRRSIVAVVLGVSAPIICGWIAQRSNDWGLFERSGSITAAIGLLTASRRYVRHSIVELAELRATEGPKAGSAQLLEDIVTAKLGLALSGFGTVIWGWGQYLGWWSFSCLLLWAFLALRDAHRDQAHLRDNEPAPAVSPAPGN